MSDIHHAYPLRHTAELLESLRSGQEVAIVDLREEADYATGHPLYAVSLPLSSWKSKCWTVSRAAPRQLRCMTTAFAIISAQIQDWSTKVISGLGRWAMSILPCWRGSRRLERGRWRSVYRC